jgi:hypothetical protein
MYASLVNKTFQCDIVRQHSCVLWLTFLKLVLEICRSEQRKVESRDDAVFLHARLAGLNGKAGTYRYLDAEDDLPPYTSEKRHDLKEAEELHSGRI